MEGMLMKYGIWEKFANGWTLLSHQVQQIMNTEVGSSRNIVSWQSAAKKLSVKISCTKGRTYYLFLYLRTGKIFSLGETMDKQAASGATSWR